MTGLSGSGPAFVYVMIEALSDGGVRVGLPATWPRPWRRRPCWGRPGWSSRPAPPGVLKDQVTSPGGTTIAGLHALERAASAPPTDAVEAGDPALGRAPPPWPPGQSCNRKARIEVDP